MTLRNIPARCSVNFRPMRNSFLRPLLVFEFLTAVIAVFTVWSQVGGQSHLDLMFWPWKLGIGLGSAGLIVMITAQLARNGGDFSAKVWSLIGLQLVLVLLAGMVTYYYHLHEPVDEEDDNDDQPAMITSLSSHMPSPSRVRGA